MAEQETRAHWSSGEIDEIRRRWAGVPSWIYSEDWEGEYCASAGFFVAGAAPGGDDDGPWLLDLEEPSDEELSTLKLCAAAPGDIQMLLARIATLEAETTALIGAIGQIGLPTAPER